MNKFLTLVNGIRTLVAAISASTGAADADKIVATSSTGQIDKSLLPPAFLDHEVTEFSESFALISTAPSLQYLSATKFGLVVSLPLKEEAVGRVLAFRNIGAKPFLVADEDASMQVDVGDVLWLHCKDDKWVEVA